MKFSSKTTIWWMAGGVHFNPGKSAIRWHFWGFYTTNGCLGLSQSEGGDRTLEEKGLGCGNSQICGWWRGFAVQDWLL